MNQVDFTTYSLVVYTISIGDYAPAKLACNVWTDWASRNSCQFIVIDKTLASDSLPLIFNKYLFHNHTQQFSRNTIFLYVDADILPHWELTKEEILSEFIYCGACLAMVEDRNGLGWIDDSLLSYSSLFSGFKPAWDSYLNAGMIMFDDLGSRIARNFCDFANANTSSMSDIRAIASRSGLGIGSDQTVFNLYIQYNKLRVSKLPERYNLGHFKRKDIVRNNKYLRLGRMLHFNGLSPQERLHLMQVFSEHYFKSKP